MSLPAHVSLREMWIISDRSPNYASRAGLFTFPIPFKLLTLMGCQYHKEIAITKYYSATCLLFIHSFIHSYPIIRAIDLDRLMTGAIHLPRSWKEHSRPSTTGSQRIKTIQYGLGAGATCGTPFFEPFGRRTCEDIARLPSLFLSLCAALYCSILHSRSWRSRDLLLARAFAYSLQILWVLHPKPRHCARILSEFDNAFNNFPERTKWPGKDEQKYTKDAWICFYFILRIL
jgi:hypothetical protein